MCTKQMLLYVNATYKCKIDDLPLDYGTGLYKNAKALPKSLILDVIKQIKKNMIFFFKY